MVSSASATGGVANYVATAREVAARFGGAWPAALSRMLFAKALYGLSAVEYGLYSLHSKPFRKLADYRTKKQTTALFARVNPEQERPRVEDKLVFHRLCLAAALPVPTLHAVLSIRKPGSTTDYPVLERFEDVLEFFRSFGEIRLILKPQCDALGTGVRFVNLRGGKPFDIQGGAIDIKSFSAGLDFDMQRDDYLIQTFVTPHPEMASLGSGKALGTFRIVTYLDGGGVQMLYALTRIPSGNNVHDNFSGGNTGNLIASLDPETGRVGPAFGRRNKAFPRLVESFDSNPDTGRPIAGQRVPQWDEIRAVVHKAVETFRELPFLGWDFALSTEGVVIIEANSNPDIVGAQVSSGLGARELLKPLYQRYQDA